VVQKVRIFALMWSTLVNFGQFLRTFAHFLPTFFLPILPKPYKTNPTTRIFRPTGTIHHTLF